MVTNEHTHLKKKYCYADIYAINADNVYIIVNGKKQYVVGIYK